MNLDHAICFRALRARDARFDGVFYVGVKTTGIYCRPVCPARTPGRDRCRFFPNAAAAERHGFRPCLRCRPELAPGLAVVDSARRFAKLAAERIEAGALNDGGSVETLSDELGISSRQLRRVVQQEFGVSPIELAQTRRLLLAKQLLTETDLPIIDVALSSGFESVRRFNALFRSRYGLAPLQIRQSASPESDNNCVGLSIGYRPPYAWPSLLAFLSDRATAGVESVDDSSYIRAVAIGRHRGWVKVAHQSTRNALSVTVATDLLPVLPHVLTRIRSMFDVDSRPDMIADQLKDDPTLACSIEESPGMRVPGTFDEFELAIRAILGQGISVKAATTLAGRLVAAFGEAIKTPFVSLNHLPPTAETLSDARKSQLTSLGITGARADSIRAISSAVASGDLRLSRAADVESAVQHMKKLPGIGDWTAQYIAMRALNWPDAFPAGDLGLLKVTGLTSPRALRELAEAWRPWRAYAAIHLWNLQNLSRERQRREAAADRPGLYFST